MHPFELMRSHHDSFSAKCCVSEHLGAKLGPRLALGVKDCVFAGNLRGLTNNSLVSMNLHDAGLLRELNPGPLAP